MSRSGGLTRHEPARQLQQRAADRQADPHRPDRRRQVRLDVPGADPAHAGRASGRHRRPLARRRAQPTSRASAGSRRADARREPRRRASRRGTTHIGEDWQALVAHPAIDIVVECTGNPIAAVEHCLAAFAHGKHVVNVTVEADAFCGPLLARKARRGRRGLFARLRRPAGADLRPGRLGAHLRLPGRRRRARPQVAAALQRIDARDGVGQLRPDARAGRARRPEPEDVQQLPRRLQAVDRKRPPSPTPPASTVPSNGLLYPPASVEDIPFVTRPISEGGVLERKGMVEVISSLEADGRQIPYDIRMGVWVTVEGETEYIRNCFEEYNAHTDPSGRYFTLYKRWHLIGLEVGMSVASVALRGEATGVRHLLERRRRGHRQARPEARRDARRRRRLHGLGQAAAGRDVDAHRRPAARPGARRQGRCGR